MARIYVATSWKNTKQPDVVKTLRIDGHQVYDFQNPPGGFPGFQWSEIDKDWDRWTADDYRHRIETHPLAALGYVSDIRGMEWADTCILLHPSGRSAHLEGGWFAGRGKRLIILTQDGEPPELMALMANHICISLNEVRQVLRMDHG